MLLEFTFPQVLVLIALVLATLAVADAVLGRMSRALTASNVTDVLAAVEQLQGLRSAGALTEAEFEAKKRELLERL